MRRLGVPVVVGVVLLALGCGGAVVPIPEHDAWIGVEAGAETVVSGRAFPLVVTRIWRKDGTAEAWDDARLAPLDLRGVAVERQDDGERIREVRRFRAYAFSLADVRVPPVPFAVRPPGGGAPVVVHAPALTVRVRPTLLPSRAGPPELGGPPLADPPARAPWFLLGAAVLGLGALGLVARRRHRAEQAPVLVEEAADEVPTCGHVALEALARLRAEADAVEEAADVVRTYVAERFGVPAPFCSTEEVLADPALASTPHDRLHLVLATADREKFAAQAVEGASRDGLFDAAEAFVRATAEEETP